MIGGMAMAFSSVSVVTNSLLLRRKRIGFPSVAPCELEEENPPQEEDMQMASVTRQYKVEGMMCKHCVGRVERALNTIEGTKAVVTLDPPVASVEFSGNPLSVEELQKILTEKAGDYQISE